MHNRIQGGGGGKVRGIRVEYTGIGFIHAFGNLLFSGDLDDIDQKIAKEAVKAYHEIKESLPIPEMLTNGDSGLISFFTEKGYKEYQSLIEKIKPALDEVSGLYADIGITQKYDVVTKEIPDKDIKYLDDYQFLIKGKWLESDGIYVYEKGK